MLRASFKKAKEEGIISIAIHWQDADSSSSNAMIEHFTDAEIMICGGQAGKAHKKQLKKLAKIKSFTDMYKKALRTISTGRFSCLSLRNRTLVDVVVGYIYKACNNFSFILSNCESAHEFAEALKVA